MSEQAATEVPKVNTAVHVGNLKFETDEAALQAYFGKIGAIKKCTIVKRHDGKSRGFAFVEFESREDAEKAVAELNETELDGRAIKVGIATYFDSDRPKKSDGRRNRRDRNRESAPEAKEEE